MPPKRPRPRIPKRMIGWREWIELPDLCPTPIKVKVDTGARTSTLHAFRLKLREEDGITIARFEMHPHQRSTRDKVETTAEVFDIRNIRSSNGKTQRRPVIRTTARLGDVTWPIELTLTRRDEMGFRMLLGRAAVRKRFVVDPGASFLVDGGGAA